MRVEDLRKHVGEVVILDLVSGVQVTTRLKDIEDDRWAILGKLLVFTVSVEVTDPTKPPHPQTNPFEHKVRNVLYGYPLFNVEEGRALDVNHIMMAHECQGDMAKVYTHVTSGIQIADAGALNALDAANKGKIQL